VFLELRKGFAAEGAEALGEAVGGGGADGARAANDHVGDGLGSGFIIRGAEEFEFVGEEALFDEDDFVGNWIEGNGAEGFSFGTDANFHGDIWSGWAENGKGLRGVF
jgi:hypothetical protein